MIVTLTTLRTAALAGPADTSNPLTIERSATARLTAKGRSDLYNEAIRAGFRTFRGVGISSRPAPMTLGAVPLDPVAESLEITSAAVTYRRVELTEAGWAARADTTEGQGLEAEAEDRAQAWDRAE